MSALLSPSLLPDNPVEILDPSERGFASAGFDESFCVWVDLAHSQPLSIEEENELFAEHLIRTGVLRCFDPAKLSEKSPMRSMIEPSRHPKTALELRNQHLPGCAVAFRGRLCFGRIVGALMERAEVRFHDTATNSDYRMDSEWDICAAAINAGLVVVADDNAECTAGPIA